MGLELFPGDSQFSPLATEISRQDEPRLHLLNDVMGEAKCLAVSLRNGAGTCEPSLSF